MAGTPTSVLGARHVTDINSVDRVRNVSPVVLMLQDDRKNLMTYLQGLGTESTSNYEFETILDEITPNRGTVGAILAESAADTNGTVDLSGTSTNIYLRMDEQIYIPSTGEIMRVRDNVTDMTAVPVVRNLNGVTSTATDAAAGSLWINIGDARAGLSRLFDSSNNLQAVSVVNEFESNYTQTFREPFGLSRRESKSKNHSGNDEKTQKTKSLMVHCEKIEHAFWFGQKLDKGNERTSTAGALKYLADSGNTEVIPTLTQEEFDDFVLRITRYGNRRKRVLFCSRFVATKISQWAYANQRVQSVGSTVKYGVHVDTIKTAGGCEVDIATADALEGLPGSATLGIHDGYAALLDMTGKKKVVFGGDDLKYAEGVEFKDMDGKVNAYLSDVGYKPGDHRKDGLITGITA